MVRVTIPDRNEVKAFLADIKADSDDVALRLILADWLEEHDDARGLFVRWQCYLSWDDAAPAPFDRDQLLEETQRLRQKHEALWLGSMREHLDGWQFDGGLLRVNLNAARLPPDGRGLHPPESFLLGLRRSIQQIFQLMTGDADSFAQEALMALVGTETWAWVETVSLRDINTSQLATLLESPLLRTVHSLDLSSNSLGDAGAAALAAAPQMIHMRSLSLSGCNIGQVGFESLAQSYALGGLQELYLDHNDAGNDGALTLAMSPHLRRLRALSLEHNRIGSEGLEALADSPILDGLRSLNLSSNNITEEGALALAATPYLEGIRRLSFYDNRPGTAGRAALARRFGGRIVGIDDEDAGTVDEDDLEME
jgi:uncharacterized protein (TIGR02996 family)